MTRQAMEDIYRIGKGAYPHEGCGFLLGTQDKDGRKVVGEVRRADNVNTLRAKDRFEIDPKEFLSVERYAGQKGVEILGFFHSHPDHPSRPSQFDRDMAWPQYSYLILSVRRGKESEAQSWVLNEEHGEFREEQLLLTE